MTSVVAVPSPGVLLAAVHDRWCASVFQVLKPLMSPRAEFWDRWRTVRFLTDQFPRFYRLESSLLECVAGALAEPDSLQLRQELDRLELTRSKLVGLCRRRGTAREASRQAWALLVQVRRHAGEIEDTMRDLSKEGPPAQWMDDLETLSGSADLDPWS